MLFYTVFICDRIKFWAPYILRFAIKIEFNVRLVTKYNVHEIYTNPSASSYLFVTILGTFLGDKLPFPIFVNSDE